MPENSFVTVTKDWEFKTGKKYCLFLILLLMMFASKAQDAWKVQKEKDGIKISSRDAPGSDFDDIRVEADFPGNIQQIAKILLDVNQYKDWSYATKKSVLIKQVNPRSLIYYTEIECPWPATNRFFYAGFELKEDAAAQSLQLISSNLPDYKPEPADLVKVSFSKGTWLITTVSPKIIHVDYILQLNPGGSLPAWILNLFSTKGPLVSFENLKKKMTLLNK